MTQNRTPLWLSAELESELRRLAADSGTPLLELVEGALRDFMRRGPADHGAAAASPEASVRHPERRACARRSVNIPAIVHTVGQDGRTGRYRVAEVRDISRSGIGLRFDGDEREHIGIGREFEILFQPLELANPVRMPCTACRRVPEDGGVLIGASFAEPCACFDHTLSGNA